MYFEKWNVAEVCIGVGIDGLLLPSSPGQCEMCSGFGNRVRRDTEDWGQHQDVWALWKIASEDLSCLDISSLEAGDINVVQTVILFISLQGAGRFHSWIIQILSDKWDENGSKTSTKHFSVFCVCWEVLGLHWAVGLISPHYLYFPKLWRNIPQDHFGNHKPCQ